MILDALALAAPVDIIRPDDASAWSLDAFAMPALIVVAALAIAAGAMFAKRAELLPTRAHADDPERDERRAFRILSRRIGLDRTHRAAVEGLAVRTRVPAVAMLISERAFDAALARHDLRTESDSPDDPAILEARRRIFAEADVPAIVR